jgi:hypothetical protein
MTSEDVIISSDELVRRNAAFATTGALAGLRFPTSDTLQSGKGRRSYVQRN